jgi:hypothetical protein
LVQVAAERDVVLVVGSGDHEGAERPEVGLDGLAQDA